VRSDRQSQRLPDGRKAFEKLRALCDAWFDLVGSGVMLGGCPVTAATAECRSRPGAIRARGPCNLYRQTYNMETFRWTCAKVATALLLLLGFTQAVTAATIPERVRDAIAKIAPELHPELHMNGGIEIHSAPGGGGTVYADNVEKECAQQPEQCDNAIQEFATRITSSLTEVKDLVPAETNVFPVVRAAQLTRSIPDALSQPFTSDSVVLYAIDTPSAMRFASGSDLKKQGIALERLQAMAMANVAHLKPVEVSVMPNSNGLVAMIVRDGYATSRLFDPEFLKMLEKTAGGPVVVAVPTRDWILAVKAGDAAAVQKLRGIAARIFHGEPYSVTADLIRWDGKVWQPVPP
jgi:uncharacterized protein YtpQ (UPF0354 family)